MTRYRLIQVEVDHSIVITFNSFKDSRTHVCVLYFVTPNPSEPPHSLNLTKVMNHHLSRVFCLFFSIFDFQLSPSIFLIPKVVSQGECVHNPEARVHTW